MLAFEKRGGRASRMAMVVDRPSCGTCQTYLPDMVDQMGIETLTLYFTDGRIGVIEDGFFSWIDNVPAG